MPKILEIKAEGDDLWVRIGKIGDLESGCALWSPEEQKRAKRSSYNLGYDTAIAGEPKDIYYE